MAMSGIKVVPEVGELFNKIKLKKTHKFAGFKITDEKKQRVVVDEDLTGDQRTTETVEEDRESFEEFKERVLACKEPRFLVFDSAFPSPQGRKINKLAFLYWCDDATSKVKKRMIYASTKDSVKKIFEAGGAVCIEVTDVEDFNHSRLMEKVLANFRE